MKCVEKSNENKDTDVREGEPLWETADTCANGTLEELNSPCRIIYR